MTIPGINETSAIFIIAEIGTNMNVFIDDKLLPLGLDLHLDVKNQQAKNNL